MIICQTCVSDYYVLKSVNCRLWHMVPCWKLSLCLVHCWPHQVKQTRFCILYLAYLSNHGNHVICAIPFSIWNSKHPSYEANFWTFGQKRFTNSKMRSCWKNHLLFYSINKTRFLSQQNVRPYFHKKMVYYIDNKGSLLE